MDSYCYQAEAYDHEYQRYADFDGAFSMESGRPWAECMERATSDARETAEAMGLDPCTVTEVYIYWIIENDKDE
ncbi:phage terminase small subunit [Pseudarthrobacter siccitolerans]|uniref:Phage terminase small subunit n=1 Tax=Pseudarthrobacter siccitolerans TaxID=861266 RepID=A0ABU0PI48_9MICC|nr:hypothetical protein [Pseudarthrobacter siccitolerans]MDQ0672979.1 phage terminase small subunit [Pseudarthrobacter siccitolerans]